MSYVSSAAQVKDNPYSPIFHNITLRGAGFDVAYRRAISENLAWDAQFGVFAMFGNVDYNDTSSAKVYSIPIPLSTHIEYQVYKTDKMGVILFGGPDFSIVNTNYRVMFDGYEAGPGNPTGTGTDTSGNTGYLYGLQFGAQAGFDLGSVKLAPFVMVAPTWGHDSVQVYDYETGSVVEKSVSMPVSTMASIGAKILFSPSFGLNFVYQTVNTTTDTDNHITYPGYHNTLISMNFPF